MAVYSMTGYANLQSDPAAADAPSPPTLGLEIRAVNSRFLDLTFKLSEELRSSEPAIRELLGKALRRGKVEVRAWIEGKHDHPLRQPSTADIQRLISIQDSVRAWLPTAAPLSVADVMGLTNRTSALPTAGLHDTLMELCNQGIDAFKESRAREGGRLATMLTGHTEQLRTLAQSAIPMVPLLVEQQRQRFLDRWKEALGAAHAGVDSDAAKDRALTEATAFAIRIDVAEELTRLSSHLEEIDRLLAKGGELGKRLDFLIQELHREANTLGSKSSSLELTRVSVDMKMLVEQMREQVQNLE